MHGVGLGFGRGRCVVMLVCDGCGDREREPRAPWVRVELVIGQRSVRTWRYCSLRCVHATPPERGSADASSDGSVA